MSILSKAKSVVSKVVSTAKNVASAVSNAITGGKSQSASVVNSLAAKQAQTPAAMTYNPNISLNSGGLGQVQKDNSILTLDKNGRPTGAISSSGVGMSVQPKTISPNMSIGSSSPIYSAPVNTYSAPRTLSGASSRSSSITSSSLASAPSISLPSAPSYSNPGVVNNGGLISSLSDNYDYNPETNSFVGKQQDPEEKRSLDLQNQLLNAIPQKENVLQDKEVQRQQREVQQQQKVVADYTSQLNSVVAQQNADLLNLRGVGAKEGVTETVYGGQAATINREAAVKALPIQAALAGAQGNLQLAQDYLTQLTTWKQEEINNTFQYKMALYGSIKDFVTGKEKTRLDQLEKDENRLYQEKRDNINSQDEWSKVAIQNGQSYLVQGIHSLDPASPTFSQDLARFQSQIVDASNSRANANANETTAGSDLSDAYAAIQAGADPLTVKRAWLKDHPTSGTSWDNYFKNSSDEIEYPSPENSKESSGLFGWGFLGL